METVYDYATKRELRELGLNVFKKEEYLSGSYLSYEIDGDLARLGIIRGDKAFEKKYLDRIPDNEYKFWLTYQDCF